MDPPRRKLRPSRKLKLSCSSAARTQNFIRNTAAVPSTSVIRYLHRRRMGYPDVHSYWRLRNSFTSERVPYLLQEKEYSLGKVNKVFASQWISHDQIVMGTKCNQLLALMLSTGKHIQLPMIKSTLPFKEEQYYIPDDNSGIHAIALNPSKTLLATGGNNPNNMAVYSLPGFDPLYIGEACHKNWIFDLKWLDDQFIVTGSRDGSIALWSVPDQCRDTQSSSTQSNFHHSVHSIRPRCVRNLTSMARLEHEDVNVSQKVRAVEFNKDRKELATLLVSSGCITFWDVCQLREIGTKKLHHSKESVCMSLSDNHALYAIGSQTHVTLLDPRKSKIVGSYGIEERCSGVRSVKFSGNILSVGTGKGAIMFVDIRQKRFLTRSEDSFKPLRLKTGDGWLDRDELFYDYFAEEQQYPNAIYTHCFDESGSMLFAAGGPLPTGLSGNYVGLFV